MPEPLKSEAEASPEGIVFRDDHDFVAVDFIGGDGAEGTIPCLEDDDRDHERGGKGGGESVCIFAGHLFGSCLGGGCRVALKGALPQSVWRTILRTGRFRRDSGDFKEALVARERCFRSKR